MQRSKLPPQKAAPLVQRILASGPLRHAEVQVHVGPAILRAVRARPRQRGSDDLLVGLRALEQQVADRAPLLGREHTREDMQEHRDSKHLDERPELVGRIRPTGRPVGHGRGAQNLPGRLIQRLCP